MTETPPESEDRKLADDESKDERRFQETLGRLVNTPHKPHEASKLGQNKTGAKPAKTR